MLSPVVIPLPVAVAVAAVLIAAALYAHFQPQDTASTPPPAGGRHRQAKGAVPRPRELPDSGMRLTVLLPPPPRPAPPIVFDPLDPRTPLSEVERSLALSAALSGDTRELVAVA
jgi:hypothetical protein